MNYYAIVLVPTRVKLKAGTRPLASEEAREWARHVKPIGEHTAKVLSVQHDETEPPPPPLAA